MSLNPGPPLHRSLLPSLLVPKASNDMSSCKGRLTVERRESDGLNVASDLFATYPLRLHLTEQQSKKALSCYMLGYGGGLVAGDSVDLDVAVQAGASAVVTSQSTSKAFCAREDRPDTKLGTSITVEEESLLVWVPQPLQCFAGSRLEQVTSVALPSPASSLLFLDWYTGGRKNYDSGGWDMDLFQTSVDIVDVTGDTIFRDSTRLCGGADLRRHMRGFHLVAMMVLVGPALQDLADRMLANFSSRSKFSETTGGGTNGRDDRPVGATLDNGLIVSCGTFPVHDNAQAGVVVRLVATSLEQAGESGLSFHRHWFHR